LTGYAQPCHPQSQTVHRPSAFVACITLSAFATHAASVDPRSDESEPSVTDGAHFQDAASYSDALSEWRSPEDVNAWIGARFVYDRERSLLLSETQRAQRQGPPVHSPGDFFAAPKGICVDLARFAVETLRSIAPQYKARYVMIEFDPLAIRGNVLRRHWVALFERDGSYYFFADSKRPGNIAGPYASTEDYAREYSTYRRRAIVAVRELESFRRRAKSATTKQPREPDVQPATQPGGPQPASPSLVGRLAETSGTMPARVEGNLLTASGTLPVGGFSHLLYPLPCRTDRMRTGEDRGL
jgi:hypothetical protein